MMGFFTLWCFVVDLLKCWVCGVSLFLWVGFIHGFPVNRALDMMYVAAVNCFVGGGILFFFWLLMIDTLIHDRILHALFSLFSHQFFHHLCLCDYGFSPFNST